MTVTRSRAAVIVATLLAAVVALTLAGCGCSRENTEPIGQINAPESESSESSSSAQELELDEPDESSSSDVETPESSPSSAVDETDKPSRDVGRPDTETSSELSDLSARMAEGGTHVTSIEPYTDVPETDEALANEVREHLVASAEKLTSMEYQGQLDGSPLGEVISSDFYAYPNGVLNLHNFGSDGRGVVRAEDIRVYENGSLDEGVVKVVFTMRDSKTDEPLWTFDGYADTKFWMFKIVGNCPGGIEEASND